MLAAGLVPSPRWLRARYGSRSVAAAYAELYGRVAAIVARTLASPRFRRRLGAN
jgi:hypothetical protein